MNIKTQLITLTLLIVAHANSTFASQLMAAIPASYYALRACKDSEIIPASLQAELKRIDDLPDHKALTEVVPIPISLAEQCLMDDEGAFKEFQNSLVNTYAERSRSELKYYTIKKELTSCPDGALKQILQIKFDEAHNQWNAHRKEQVECANCIVKDQPAAAYNFMADRHNALANQASILLARTQNLEQQKETLWQQEKQSLKEKLKKSQEDLEQLRILHRRPIDPKAKEMTQSFDMQKFVQLACIKKNT